MKPLVADLDEIRRAVALFLEAGTVLELRAPKSKREGVIAGYFSDVEKCARAAKSIDARAPGIYVTLNPVNPDLLSRAENRVEPRARETTIDRDVVRRRWLLLDFDAKRPAGISSTDTEHDAALEVARSAATELGTAGWPAPVFGDSGNGAHLLYRINLLNDPASAELVKSVLHAAAARFNAGVVEVDLSVFNASRISKLYGTVARKGDSNESRPHRLSRLIEVPDQLGVVSAELLRAFGGHAPVKADPPKRSPATSAARRDFHPSAQAFDLERFIVDHSIGIHRGPDVHDGSQRWQLEHCPFDPSHAAPDAAIFRNLQTGRLGFKCLHNSCDGKDWEAFRDFYEPGYSRRRGSTPAHQPPAESDVRDEIPPNAADVEAAVDGAIAADDLVCAMRLAPDVARLSEVARAVVLAKLGLHFKKKFSRADFKQAMKAAGGSSPPDDDRPDPAGDDADLPDLRPFPLTDAGNGERIALLYAGDVRYCVEMKRWLIWDGHRWAIDEFFVMRQKAKRMCRILHAQAHGDSGFMAHARQSESYAGITNALGSAASEKGVPISAAELDQHPFLLNCPNGVVDLRHEKLLPHNREFLITKLCPVPYQPGAKCGRFLDFINWAMGANPEAEITERTARLVGFLQRAFGYALTSDVGEKAVFVFHGERGNNGKTTLLTLFRDLLGKDYSGQLVIDTVMSMKNQDATTRADLADLRGVRLVVTSEVEKEHRLSEGKIKYITAGMGSIKSCRKYENPIEFIATHKLFMDCNHRPTVRGVDDAIWRRLKLVPFSITISEDEKDTQLPDKLRAELPGILAWAVRGCAEWFKSGLGDPPEVSEANQEWREHDDPLKDFLEDCCKLDPEGYVKSSDLSAAYERWAKRSRERFPLGREALKERLLAKGLRESRSRRIENKQTRTWEGIELLPDVEKEVREGPSASWFPDHE